MERPEVTGETGRVVLLVDDDPTFARDAASVLSGVCSVVWISGSAGVVEGVASMRPRLVLLDMNMPRHFAPADEYEGLEVLGRLPEAERSRVIVVTRSLTEGMRERLEWLGVRRVYLKSESAVRLRELVQEGLA